MFLLPVVQLNLQRTTRKFVSFLGLHTLLYEQLRSVFISLKHNCEIRLIKSTKHNTHYLQNTEKKEYNQHSSIPLSNNIAVDMEPVLDAHDALL